MRARTAFAKLRVQFSAMNQYVWRWDNRSMYCPYCGDRRRTVRALIGIIWRHNALNFQWSMSGKLVSKRKPDRSSSWPVSAPGNWPIDVSSIIWPICGYGFLNETLVLHDARQCSDEKTIKILFRHRSDSECEHVCAMVAGDSHQMESIEKTECDLSISKGERTNEVKKRNNEFRWAYNFELISSFFFFVVFIPSSLGVCALATFII